MIISIAVATMMLILATMPVLALGKPPSAVQPTVLGQTGTMYDGNNAKLQMPSEQNAYVGSQPQSTTRNRCRGEETGPRAAKLAAGDLEEQGEQVEAVWARLQKGGFTPEQVVEDWFPAVR